jgi:hypothetical protein
MTYPADVVADARAWSADVVADPEAVEDAADADVMAYVARNYCGGIGGFMQDREVSGGGW